MNNISHWCPVIILLAIAPIFSVAQKLNKDDTNTWWLNVPSAPIIFDFKPIKNPLLEDLYKREYWFGLRNRSSKAVSEYSLGCVVEEGKDLKVVKRFYANTITDGGYGHDFFWSAFDASDPLKDERYGRAACKKSRVAVVRVVFIDNSSWSLPGAGTV
jgi:hypothetical protein